jgi:hypothetical protein
MNSTFSENIKKNYSFVRWTDLANFLFDLNLFLAVLCVFLHRGGRAGGSRGAARLGG